MAGHQHARRIRQLLATTSLFGMAALLAGLPPAAPASAAPVCTHPIGAAFDNPSGHTVANVCVQNTSFSGSITNEGTIGPSGITFQAGTISGNIQSSGVVTGGIALDQASAISATAAGAAGILISGPTLT